MSYESATKCDAEGCRERTFDVTGEDFVPKGWTHAKLTTRTGVVEVDFCEKHSRPIHEAVAQLPREKP